MNTATDQHRDAIEAPCLQHEITKLPPIGIEPLPDVLAFEACPACGVVAIVEIELQIAGQGTRANMRGWFFLAIGGAIVMVVEITITAEEVAFGREKRVCRCR